MLRTVRATLNQNHAHMHLLDLAQSAIHDQTYSWPVHQTAIKEVRVQSLLLQGSHSCALDEPSL